MRPSLLIFATLGLLVEIAFGETFQVPPLRAPVNDLAQMIDEPTERLLNQALRQMHQEGGAQIAVLTLDSIGDLTIEQASIQVVDQWQLGDKKRDDGLLLFVVQESKQLRIEVGQGLEGDVPDALAKRIITETITPLFKSGQFSEGVLAGTYEIARLANPRFDVRPFFESSLPSSLEQKPTRQPGIIDYLVFLGVLIFLIFTPMGRTLLMFMLLTRSGGGGGSGGGFRGGGGGFSGGGASGGW